MQKANVQLMHYQKNNNIYLPGKMFMLFLNRSSDSRFAHGSEFVVVETVVVFVCWINWNECKMLVNAVNCQWMEFNNSVCVWFFPHSCVCFLFLSLTWTTTELQSVNNPKCLLSDILFSVVRRSIWPFGHFQIVDMCFGIVWLWTVNSKQHIDHF